MTCSVTRVATCCLWQSHCDALWHGLSDVLSLTIQGNLPAFSTTNLWWTFQHIYSCNCNISKKQFRLGGMAPSEWTRSVRAVRYTLVADYSAPGVNTTRGVAYRPPIAISPFLLALSVFYFEQTLWRCGRLWPYVGMCTLGTRLHRDCNGWRCENLSSRSFYIKLEERRKVRRCDPTRLWGSTQLRGSTKSRTEHVRPKVAIDRVWNIIVW